MVKHGINNETNCFLNDYQTYYYEVANCVIYFKGFISFINEEIKIENWTHILFEHLVNEKQSFNTFLISELNKATGLFSLIIRAGEDYYIIGDIIRSQPIFYGLNEDELFITNNLEEFQKGSHLLEIENDKLEEFLVYGFVFGNGTVYKNVFGLQAGEIVEIKDKGIKTERYFEFKPAEKLAHYKNVFEFTRLYDQNLTSIFSRMLMENLNVSRWIIPLSGGHDSRLTVNYLYRLGIKNVLCFSYGKLNNEQALISKEVAEILGFDWQFVEYTEQKWQNLHENGLFDSFTSYSFNGVSTPLPQDFLAVYELKERKILKTGDVFVKSHGDFIAGSHLNDIDVPCTTEQDALNRVILRHCKINNKSAAPVKGLKKIYKEASVEPLYFQEYFDWQERQAKFIVNSIRVYEFFGFKCLVPFWSRENVDFWRAVPADERTERKMFFESEKHGILIRQLASIPFAGENKKVSGSTIINKLKKNLPSSLIIALLRITGHKVKSNEAMNMIYALKAKSIKELLDPVSDFPEKILHYFKESLLRFPYQIDPHLMTTLYAIRKLLDLNKNTKKEC